MGLVRKKEPSLQVRKYAPLPLAVVTFLLLAGAACAKESRAHDVPSLGNEMGQKAPASTSAPSTNLTIPSPRNLFIMIRTTLIALHQANVTGNYSVLRDLGAPDFKQSNSVERLSAAFANLRTRGGDIAAVALAMPKLSQPPVIDKNGMLRLTGSFDTKPDPLYFDLVFQAVGGFWQIEAIGARFVPAESSKTSNAPASETSKSAGKGIGAKVRNSETKPKN
jgi:hypothetical protein